MQRFLHFFCIAVVAIIGICLLIVQPFPILHDYPEWMYQGWLAHQLLLGSDASILNQFSLVPYPVPNSITQFGIAILNQFASPIVSGKIWLVVYLLSASAVWTVLSLQLNRDWVGVGTVVGTDAKSGVQLVAEVGGKDRRHKDRRYDGTLNLLLTMTFTLGPGFWNGYTNFQFALLFWGVYLLAMRQHRDGLLLHLLLSLLIFFSHASVFVAFVVLVLSRMLFARISWRNIAAIAPSLLLFGWYLLATNQLDMVGPMNALGLVEWAQYKVYTVAKQGYFHNFILADGSSLLGNVHALYLVGVVLNLAVVVFVTIWLLHQSWCLVWGAEVLSLKSEKFSTYFISHDQRASCAVGYRATLISLLTLILLFLAAGKDNFGVVNLGERFFIAALVLVLVMVPVFVRSSYHRYVLNAWTSLAVAGAVYAMVATIVISRYPVQEYAVVRSTISTTLDGAIDDIYANSHHKLFNHRIYIYADHGIWLQQPGPDLLPLTHMTSFVVEK